MWSHQSRTQSCFLPLELLRTAALTAQSEHIEVFTPLIRPFQHMNCSLYVWSIWLDFAGSLFAIMGVLQRKEKKRQKESVEECEMCMKSQQTCRTGWSCCLLFLFPVKGGPEDCWQHRIRGHHYTKISLHSPTRDIIQHPCFDFFVFCIFVKLQCSRSSTHFNIRQR